MRCAVVTLGGGYWAGVGNPNWLFWGLFVDPGNLPFGAICILSILRTLHECIYRS